MTALHGISHHPGKDLIAAYAAGSLDEATALAIATHMTLCPSCRRQAASFEALGASLMEALPETAMAEGAFNDIFSEPNFSQKKGLSLTVLDSSTGTCILQENCQDI